MKRIDNLPFAEYINHRDHISNHQLAYLDDCPAAFQYYFTAPPEPPSSDQIEGSCFDLAVQDLDVFEAYVKRDDKRKTIAEVAKHGWLLGWERYDRLLIMAKNLWAHPVIKKLLTRGNYQVSIFTALDEVKVKSRPDFLPDDLPIVLDFKTTRVSPTPRALRHESAKYKYYRQAAFYLDQQPDRIAFNLIWVPKVPPYLPVVEEVAEETIEFGRWQYKKLLATYKKCMETGIWPGHWQIRKHEIPRCVMQEEGYAE